MSIDIAAIFLPFQITSNLDVFIRHHNRVQFWVATEILLTSNLGKRTNILKKFIKSAAQYVTGSPYGVRYPRRQ
jgi:hypothetical protein